VQVAGGERRDPARQLDRPGMGVAPDRDEVELPHLLCHRVAQLGASVAGVDAEESREAVEIAVAVVIPDVATLAADDDRHLMLGAEGAHPREVHPEVALSLFLKAGRLSLGLRRGACCCHPLPPLKYLASAYNATPEGPALQAELCEISFRLLVRLVQRG